MWESFMLRSNYAELAKQMNSIGAAVTTVFLFTRLWARTTRSKGLWWDDYFLIATWLLQLIGNGLSAAAPQRGFNIHNGAEHGWTFIFASLSFFYVSMACSKTAFAATLLRLSGSGGTRVLLWLVVAVAWAFGSAMAIVSWLTICEQRVDVSITGGTCVPLKTLLWIHIGNNVATVFVDVVLACVPWRVVSKIYIPKRERLAVAASMSLTGCAAVVVVVRAVITVYGQKLERRGLDWTYGSFVVFGLHQFEITIYVVAQTVPLLRVLYLGSESKVKADKKSPRPEGLVEESGMAGQLMKGKVTATREIVHDIELVQLTNGKIVARDSEEGKAFEKSQAAASKSAGTAAAQVTAEGLLVADVLEAPEGVAGAAIVDDEVHKLWMDMGLTRRAWSQSPSPPQAAARHRSPVSSNLDITAPA